MASFGARLAKRALPSSIRFTIKASSSSATKPLSTPPLLRRLSLSSCQAQLGCVQSLLPLHTAVASARMISCLTATSTACRALSQGT